jgi:hypothetical protein
MVWLLALGDCRMKKPPIGDSFCFKSMTPAPTDRVQKVLFYSTTDF